MPAHAATMFAVNKAVAVPMTEAAGNLGLAGAQVDDDLPLRSTRPYDMEMP
jgi:hypothetical protein